MKPLRSNSTPLIYLLLLFTLTACGGGGGGEDSDAPFDLANLEDTVISVPEDTPTETIIGSLTQAVETDFGADTTFLVSGDTENIYVNNMGQISLLPGFTFDYETKNLYLYTISVQKSGEAAVTVTLQIDVTDVVEGPRLQGPYSFTVDENITSSVLIGNVIPEGVADDAFTQLSLSGDESDNFIIQANGNIKRAELGHLDADLYSSYSLTAQGINAANETSSVSVTINVNHVDTVPILESTVLNVNENSGAGTVVGLVNIGDDGGSAITSFELDGLGAGGFNINSQGQITVSGLMSLDYESLSAFGLRVRATNSTGQSDYANLNIYVDDIDVPPTLVDTTLTIQERAPVGSYVGTVTIQDIGESAINNFTLTGNAYNLFTIDNNGIITVAYNDMISTATRDHYSLSAMATNEQGDSNQVSVTIQIESLVDNNPPKQLQHLVQSNPVKYDFAGNALALLDKQLYVGIAQHDYAKASNPDFLYNDAGTVAIFNDISSAPSSEFKLKIPDNSIALYNKFGSSVSAVNHETQGVLVGVGVEGGGTTNVITGLSNGQVWIYKKIADDDYRNSLLVDLSDSQLAGSGGLGHSLALGEEYFISGVEGGTRGVFLFSYDALGQFDGSTGFISKLRPANLASNSDFGENISLDGNYFVVSASNDSSVSGIELVENTGAVYLYKYNPTTKSAELVQRIQASDAQADEYFGQAVSISGGHIAVANRKNSVYLFKLNSDDTVTELSKVTHAYTEVSTSPMASIVFKDNLLIAGVPSDTRSFSSYAGSVHIYALEDNALVYKHTLEAEFPESSATYGNKLAFDGRYLAVSAPAEDNSSISGTGAVYVYDVKPEVKPKLTNYMQDILLKDNADFSNLYEFEAESPQGGPFTYAVSGQDEAKFTIIDNRLLAVSGFDALVPEDANEDNIYELIVTVTDGSGTSRAYALQVTVWQHQVMYYRDQRYSEIATGTYKYGYRMFARNNRLFVQELNDLENLIDGKWRDDNLYIHIYETNTSGQLVSTDRLLSTPTPWDEDAFAYWRPVYAIGEDYLAIEQITDTADDLYSILLYPILADGSLGAATALATEGAEKTDGEVNSIYAMGNHLIVNRGEIFNTDTQTWEPSATTYTIDNDGLAQRQGKQVVNSTGSHSKNFICDQGNVGDGVSCYLWQLNTTTHQLDFLPDLAYEDFGKLRLMGSDSQSGLDYMLSEDYSSDQIILRKFNMITGELDFVNSITRADIYSYFSYVSIYNTEDLIIMSKNGPYYESGETHVFKFNLTDNSFRHLGSIDDIRLEHFNAVQKIGKYLYFADDNADSDRGTIYIYELDPDL